MVISVFSFALYCIRKQKILLAVIYTNIHLRKIVHNVCYFHKKTALTAIIMLRTSIALFRGNSSSKVNLIFIYFSAQSYEFLVSVHFVDNKV